MSTIRQPPTAVVTGAYQGLGQLIADHLENNFNVVRWDLRFEESVDLCSLGSVHHAAAKLDRCHVLVNCAGYNKLAPLNDLEQEAFNYHMAVNARSHYFTVQALLEKLRASNGTVCNIISNASHMPMRMSLAYNASKAAAAMMTRQMARELGPNPTIFGISPNRLAGTPMSMEVDQQVAALRGWTWEETRQKQLEALPIGEETDPATVAEFIGFLLTNKRRHRFLHGAIMEYGI